MARRGNASSSSAGPDERDDGSDQPDGPTRPIIGLAGGIGAGKSAVARILARLGCLVVNSDEQGRHALRDPAIRETLVSWWGDGVLDAHGHVDRRRVAAIVFADPAERRRLEALTHPWIEARRAEEFASAPPETPALVIDAPLLFEAGLDSICDAVIFVDAPRSLRLARVQATRGWDADELRRREDSQMPLDEKRSRADHVLRNDRELSDMEAQIRTILSTIVDSRPVETRPDSRPDSRKEPGSDAGPPDTDTNLPGHASRAPSDGCAQERGPSSHGDDPG